MIENIKQFIGLSRTMGIIFTLKYKLGIAKEGIDFISVGQEEYMETQNGDI